MNKILSIIILELSILLIVAVNNYSKVNSISTGLLLVYVLIPSIIIEAIFALLIILGKKSKWIFIIQIIIFLSILYWFIDHVIIK
jgi:hypothetical protein